VRNHNKTGFDHQLRGFYGNCTRFKWNSETPAAPWPQRYLLIPNPLQQKFFRTLKKSQDRLPITHEFYYKYMIAIIYYWQLLAT
jgi:hypothetical protein